MCVCSLGTLVLTCSNPDPPKRWNLQRGGWGGQHPRIKVLLIDLPSLQVRDETGVAGWVSVISNSGQELPSSSCAG